MPNFKLGFVLIVLIQVSLSSNVRKERGKVNVNIWGLYVENVDDNFWRTICARKEIVFHFSCKLS